MLLQRPPVARQAQGPDAVGGLPGPSRQDRDPPVPLFAQVADRPETLLFVIDGHRRTGQGIPVPGHCHCAEHIGHPQGIQTAVGEGELPAQDDQALQPSLLAHLHGDILHAVVFTHRIQEKRIAQLVAGIFKNGDHALKEGVVDPAEEEPDRVGFRHFEVPGTVVGHIVVLLHRPQDLLPGLFAHTGIIVDRARDRPDSHTADPRDVLDGHIVRHSPSPSFSFLQQCGRACLLRLTFRPCRNT